jgi:uncharacterized 2Fe-2S/4Fe-4S cluster protein (DUF4445 family)
MSDSVQLDLEPAGISCSVKRGAGLREILSGYGVEFPCGGPERCGGCRVRLLRGAAVITAEDAAVFSKQEIEDGWRLACHLRADVPLAIEVGQWDATILADDDTCPATDCEGLGIAIDLGTTTVVAQLLDLRSGGVLGVRSLLNPQAAYGSDIMSRIECALRGANLTRLIREDLGNVVRELAGGKASELREVVLVGNTVMHHLFCGLDVEPLSHVPFRSPHAGEQCFRPEDLGWNISSVTNVRFLPAIGGFVGSDILAGIVSVGLHRGRRLRALVDLGTNGEIALGNESRILCASTAAGAAFEAGNISTGMRAATGAISHVTLQNGQLSCSVIGDTAPRGLCGSGLVDAVACFLRRGDILPSGRFARRTPALAIAGTVTLTQPDVRELQLAKGAIAAGLRILLDHWGARSDELDAVFLSGAFGNYVSVKSAARIGLLPVESARIHPSGNTALRGAKLLLTRDYTDAIRACEHVSLAADAKFQDMFAENLVFPEASDPDPQGQQVLARALPAGESCA